MVAGIENVRCLLIVGDVAIVENFFRTMEFGMHQVIPSCAPTT